MMASVIRIGKNTFIASEDNKSAAAGVKHPDIFFDFFIIYMGTSGAAFTKSSSHGAAK